MVEGSLSQVDVARLRDWLTYCPGEVSVVSVPVFGGALLTFVAGDGDEGPCCDVLVRPRGVVA